MAKQKAQDAQQSTRNVMMLQITAFAYSKTDTSGHCHAACWKPERGSPIQPIGCTQW